MRGFSLAVAITLAAAGARAGDPDVADLLLKKAKKAFAAKSYEEAEATFRRALKEVTPLPEARLGLGETLEKLGRPAEALEACRTCVKEIEQQGDPAKLKAIKARAQQAISRLQGRQGELAKLNESFIRKCLDFGRKRASSDPAWARKAFETVLLLDPSNEIAKGYLKQLPREAGAAPDPEPPADEKPKPSSERFGEPVILAELWEGAPEWAVREDAIIGDSPKEGKLFWLTEMPLEGRFSIRGRFRVSGQRDRFGYGVFFGSEGKEPWWGLFFRRTGSVSLERCENEENQVARDVIVEGFDHNAWHTIQLDIQPGDVTVTLDGKRLFEHNESDRKTFDGQICLYVQYACIEWRDLEVKR